MKNIDFNGGGGEIRTHGRVSPTTVFKTVAFNRSATPPKMIIIAEKIFVVCLLYNKQLYSLHNVQKSKKT